MGKNWFVVKATEGNSSNRVVWVGGVQSDFLIIEKEKKLDCDLFQSTGFSLDADLNVSSQSIVKKVNAWIIPVYVTREKSVISPEDQKVMIFLLHIMRLKLQKEMKHASMNN